MCGIIGYTGSQQASPFLLGGLKRLEYRGYDSAGGSVLNGDLQLIRAVGPIAELEAAINKQGEPQGTCGIAHTRWATHGVPSQTNAHPHADCTKTINIVHNGIIENHESLRRALALSGHTFQSQTDSEVIAHLFEEALAQGMALQEAFDRTLDQLTGAYGIVISCKQAPDTLLVARMGSPIVLGKKDGDRFVCSDAHAMADWIDDVMYLDDGERALLAPGQEPIIWTKHGEISKEHKAVDWEITIASKQRYAHFMLKEIMEQPAVLRDTMRGRLLADTGEVHFGGLEDVRERLREMDRIIIVACGTAYYAGCVGEYMLEHYGVIPVEVELASEFRYRHPIIDRHTAVLAISQSGETADTLAAMREAKRQGALALGIVNVPGSTIARETDAGIYTRAGAEIGVASTKAFLAQTIALAMLTLFFGRDRGLDQQEAIRIAQALKQLPQKVKQILEQRTNIAQLAQKYQWMQNALFLGRTYHAPIAYEGALKLKEISLIHAEGYSAGEMKHGPLALIDERFPSIVLCPRDEIYEKTVSNMQALKARKGPIIAITDEGNQDIHNIADDAIFIPHTHQMLSPLLATIPTQLFAYEMSLIQGYDPDKPRNLAKSVTVE